jgi:hypothetical protein
MSVTVGRVADFENTHFWERNWGKSPNFFQVHLRGNLAKRVAYMIEGTNYRADGKVGQDNEQFVRAALEVAIQDVVKFVDTVVLEQLYQVDDKAFQGLAVSLKKAVADWTFQLTYSHKGEDVSKGDAYHMPLEDFYL